MDPIKTRKDNEEARIQAAIISVLQARQWFCKETHGNLYSYGFPDIYVSHRKYGTRWIEVKKPVGYKFTPAQIEFFPLFSANGSPIWVATTHEGVEDLIMKRPENWFQYLQGMC